MKGMKKTLAFLLALAVTAIPLFGCQSGGDVPSDGGSASSSSTPEVSTGEDGRPMEGNLYLEGLPLVKETETFSVLIDDSGDAETVKDRAMLKLLAEQTNVDVDWQIYPYEVAMEKKNLLLSSGDYPDVIGGWLLGTNDMVKYGSKEKIFIPLEELFEKYSPKMMEVLEMDNIRRDMTLPDGHIYNPPYPIPEPQCIFGPWINKTWLDNLGLSMPTTTDELYDVLVAFRDRDPNGNGRQDEIPFSSRSDHFYNWFAFFGYPVSDTDLIMVDGEPAFTGTMDFYKDGLNYFHKLYADGLMDPELFTQDMNTYNNKGKAEDAVYGVCIMYYPYDISPGLDENELVIRGEDYVPLPPITSPNCDTPRWRRGSTGLTLFRTQLAITDKAKNPATIVRWLDNLYQTDNSAQAHVGVYGITGQKNDDGTYEKLPKTDITGAPGYSEWIGAMPKYVPLDVWNNTKRSPSDQMNQDANDALDAAWANNMTEMTPAIWMSAEESAQISTIQTDIGNYMKQKRAEWITGSADVNAEWDAYLQQLDAMGLQTLIEVQSNAIKKAMGS